MNSSRVRITILICLMMFAVVASAQISPATGTPPVSSFGGGPDIINLGNLNIELSAPVVNKPGRGLPFVYNLVFNNSFWSKAGSSGSYFWTPVTGNSTWGWTNTVSNASGYLTHTTISNHRRCIDPDTGLPYNNNYTLHANYVYTDPKGTKYQFTYADATYTYSGGPN